MPMKRSKNIIQGYLSILPLFAGCLVFYAVPFVLVLIQSVTRGQGIFRRFVGLEHYGSMLENDVFTLAFGNTMRFLAIAIPLVLLLSFLIAFAIRSRSSAYERLRNVLLLPYVMPVAATVLLIDQLFGQMGLIIRGLLALGIPVVDWLHSAYAFWVVLMLYLWKNTGYGVVLLLSGLATIPDEVNASAQLDGATTFQQLRFITIPQMWYSIFFTTVFSVINAFKCFREIFLIGGTHPHESIYMLQHYINNAFEKMSYSKLAVASILLLAVVTVVFVLGYRFVHRKEAYRE